MRAQANPQCTVRLPCWRAICSVLCNFDGRETSVMIRRHRRLILCALAAWRTLSATRTAYG